MAPRIKRPSGIMTEPKTRLFDMVDFMLAEYGLEEPPSEELKEPDLLPCPWCGSMDIILPYKQDDGTTQHFTPFCNKCMASAPCYGDFTPTRANAIAAWNRRYE